MTRMRSFVAFADGEFIGIISAASNRQASIDLAPGITIESISAFRQSRRWASQYRLYRSIADADPVSSASVIDEPDLYDRKFYPA